MSSHHTRRLVVLMVYNDDDEKDQSHKKDDSEIPKAVKQNSEKIELLESGQREFLNQLQLLTKKMEKQPLHDDDKVSSNHGNLGKPITHKEMTEMLAKATQDNSFKKKESIPKYKPKMDLVPFTPKYNNQSCSTIQGHHLHTSTWFTSTPWLRV